jgi:hypothetical protein
MRGWRVIIGNGLRGDGMFLAAGARMGKLLFSFQTNLFPHASPMTYMFDHRQ